MRILQVRFKNLNSLVGEWQIDLTHPAYTSDGIFAITGPTGAGKTTILDAICLALYGRTPRLNKVTKGGNEIMSRQTGECFAEVTFETQSGRFRCHWGQHRARKKPDGELQAPKHEISNADSGEIFESRIRGVADQIESATGMDFERFTRSMLLAQGGFAAFLQAAPNLRAAILEQITGTEIYSEISIRVHERQREELEKLNLLQAETGGIAILEQAQEQEIEQALVINQKEEAELASKTIETEKAIAWLNIINVLNKEISSLADKESKLQIDIEAFKPDLEKLNWALSASSLDSIYATLTAARIQQMNDSVAMETEEVALPRLESSAKDEAEALRTFEQRTTRAKEELKMAAPTLLKIRSIDQKIADQRKAVLEGDTACKKAATKIDADKKALLEEQEKRSKAHESLDHVDSYLKEHAQDEWLISGLAGIEEQLKGLQSKQHEIIRKEVKEEEAIKALRLITQSLENYQKQSGIRKQEREHASNQIQQGKDTLSQLLGDQLLREYRTQKETLLRELAFLEKIVELEDHRAKLEDGKPCPLCGANEHPFAEGNVPIPDVTEKKIAALTELISKAEDQETIIKELEEAESLARRNLTDAENLESSAVNGKKAAEKTLAEIKDGLEELRADFNVRRQAVSIKLKPLGLTDISEADIPTLTESLRERLKAWQVQIKKKLETEKLIADIGSELKRLDAIIETQTTALAEKLEQLEILKGELASGSAERNLLYGDKNPNDEENRLNKAISDAEVAERQIREKHNDLQQKWNTAKANVESLKKRIDQREPELKKQEVDFSAALTSSGFLNEKQFLAAILPSEQKSELAGTAKILEERKIDLKARQKDREKRLNMEIDRKITEKSLEELEPEFKEYEESLKELRDIVAGFKYSLKENAVAKERVKDKQTAIDAQKIECRRWENLHDLIGSADGRKYRNFAQGLTFEMMVGHANRQLLKMTDRYLLIRDGAQPLELNVIDNYQAGEIRSTMNLSGGESFIVSLSLALGLSNMASKNVRVDSLFLDEGFGTLDEEALETALETLAGLQQDGKLIGVISHVPALKERISTQIQVTPQTGGMSQISGPGCGKVSTKELVTDAG